MPGVTNEPRLQSICLACGGALAPALERFASLRCHDCRETEAPIRPELLKLLTTPVYTPEPQLRVA